MERWGYWLANGLDAFERSLFVRFNLRYYINGGYAIEKNVSGSFWLRYHTFKSSVIGERVSSSCSIGYIVTRNSIPDDSTGKKGWMAEKLASGDLAAKMTIGTLVQKARRQASNSLASARPNGDEEWSTISSASRSLAGNEPAYS